MAGPHVDKIQETLLKDIKERGIAHVLEWIDGYYDLLAEATIKDRIASLPKEEHPAYLMTLASHTGRYASNHSTSQGHNMFRLAEAVAAARSAQPYVSLVVNAMGNTANETEAPKGRKANI